METLSDLLTQGDAALAAGDTENAIFLFEKALAPVNGLESDQSRGAIYQRLGRAYAILNMWAEAAASYEQAAAIAHHLGPGFVAYELQAQHQASQAYLALALTRPIVAARKDAYQKAQTAAQMMLELARSEGNGLAECMAWASLGNAQGGLGNYEAAAKSIDRAFAIAHEAGDIASAAGYLVDLGFIQLRAGRAFEAEQHYERGLRLLRFPDKHPSLAARLQDGLAEAHLARQRATAARFHAEQAIDLVQQTQDPHLEARHRSTLGRVLTRLGDYELAADQHRAAISLLQGVEGNRAYLDLAGEWGNLATCYRLLGRHQPALEALTRALDLAQRQGDKLAEGRWQDTLGSVYEELGDFGAAESCHRQALQIFETLGYEGEAATAHNNLGTTFYRRGLLETDDRLFEIAAEHFRRARDGMQRAGNVVMAANAIGNLGIVYLRTERHMPAVEAFEEARDALQAAGYPLEAGHQLENLGLAYANYLGKPDKALDYYKQAIQIAKDFSDIDGLRIALTRSGDLYRKQLKDTLAAKNAYEEAIDLLESGRATLSLSSHRAGLQARSLAAYDGLIQVHWQAGDFETAFDWAERARARAFLEQVRLFASLPIQGLPTDLLDKERRLIRQTRALEQRILSTQDPVERATLARRRREIQDSLNSLWDEMAHLPEGERYVALRRGTPVTARSLQAWLDSGHSDTALVAYYSLPEAVYAWVFRSSQSMQGIDIPIGQTALGRYLGIFEREVSGFRRYDLGSRAWEEKLSPLITLLRPYLEGVHTLYFVPHGRLHNLALHALSTENGPLDEDFAIAYAPSAGILLRQTPTALTSLRRPMQAFALGFTPNRKEAATFAEATTQVAAIFNTQPYLGRAASGMRLKRKAPEADLIYILCHGEFNKQDPLDSRLQLAYNPLTARDILAMDLSGALVILAACEVGMSQVNPGDELIGLSHAFLIAGASAVLAARWTVQTTSAIKLVREFYTQWYEKGMPSAAALQQAMRTIRHHRQRNGSQPYTHPFFWAPFTLIGNAD